MHINPAIVYAGGGLLPLPYYQAHHSVRHTIRREHFTPTNGPQLCENMKFTAEVLYRAPLIIHEQTIIVDNTEFHLNPVRCY